VISSRRENVFALTANSRRRRGGAVLGMILPWQFDVLCNLPRPFRREIKRAVWQSPPRTNLACPSACSMRGKRHQKVKGLHCARHVQNSYANWSNESDFSWAKERGDKRNNPNSKSRHRPHSDAVREITLRSRRERQSLCSVLAPASSPLFLQQRKRVIVHTNRPP